MRGLPTSNCLPQIRSRTVCGEFLSGHHFRSTHLRISAERSSYSSQRYFRRKHPEWENESIDGFFFSSAVKSQEASAALVGTCILISDQAVTPFAMNLSLLDPRGFRAFRIRLGESGVGTLGISGPQCNSGAAREMLVDLNARMAVVDWVYDIAL
jgi:hypothetical protein